MFNGSSMKPPVLESGWAALRGGGRAVRGAVDVRRGAAHLPRAATKLRRASAWAVLILCATPTWAQQPKLLQPERAFAFSVQAVDESTVEARFAIANGYYLYREKLKFSVEPVALGGAPSLPPGKMKHDEFFGDVETYRGAVAVRLPLQGAQPGSSVTIKAESQGCADAGVCYPPQVQKVTVALPARGARPGDPVSASPKKSWFN
jgi:thiol:disulfide interchange protein DsbD